MWTRNPFAFVDLNLVALFPRDPFTICPLLLVADLPGNLLALIHGYIVALFLLYRVTYFFIDVVALFAGNLFAFWNLFFLGNVDANLFLNGIAPLFLNDSRDFPAFDLRIWFITE